jgi:hypothetical protein
MEGVFQEENFFWEETTDSTGEKEEEEKDEAPEKGPTNTMPNHRNQYEEDKGEQVDTE